MPNKYLDSVQVGRLITKIKSHVSTSIANLVGSAPGTLDTLQELAAALGDDPNFATTIATLIDTKCAQAKLDAHPVGSFYESTDPTSPATLFGGTWEEKIPDGELIGSVMAYSGNGTVPDGWLLCNGAAINRATYSALFTVIGTTYGTGDGSSTFNLPDLSDKFIQGDETAGTVKAAGIPNITGSISSAMPIINTSVSEGQDIGVGAFSAKVNSYSWARTSGSSHFVNIDINASRSSSIYGKSNTVQPPAITMRYLIYTGVTSKQKWLRTA